MANSFAQYRCLGCNLIDSDNMGWRIYKGVQLCDECMCHPEEYFKVFCEANNVYYDEKYGLMPNQRG